MDPASVAAVGLPVIGDFVKAYFGNQQANRDRALTKQEMAQQKLLAEQQMAQQEKNNSFQRLMSLQNQSQGMQNQLAGANRLFSLRNAGGNV